MATVLTVAAVATLEPDVAANAALAPMLACISPPGNQPSHFSMEPYMRSAMPARSMISPSRMNIGIATRMKSVLVDQKISPVARNSGSMAYMAQTDRSEERPVGEEWDRSGKS